MTLFLSDPDFDLYASSDVRAVVRELAEDPDDVALAYLGGLVDGEGYIGIKKSPRGRRSCYHERIQVRMVHEGAIALLAHRMGGNYYRESPHANGGRPLYCWQASDLRAARIAATLLPWLIVKHEAAVNLLRLRASKNDPRARLRGGPSGRLMPSDVVEHRESLYQRAKTINAGR